MDYVFYIATVLGALAVWLIMPSKGSKHKKLGALLGLAALGGLLLFLLRQTGGVGGEQARPDIFYYVFTLIAVLAAVRMITHPRPVYAALYFVLVVLAVAGLFIVLEAEFMAFALIIIYTGAILVTYMFVIMLAQQSEASATDRRAREPLLAILVSFVLMGTIAGKVGDWRIATPPPVVQMDQPGVEIGRASCRERV